MLDFEAAKRIVHEEWLRLFANKTGGELAILDDECVEYEWGWFISCWAKEPEKVHHEWRWAYGYELVDRLTGATQRVGTGGINNSIVKLLAARPPSLRSRDLTVDESGLLTKLTISTRAYTPLRELESGRALPAETIEIFQYKKPTS